MAEKVQALATASPRVRRVTSPACTQSHFPGKFTLHLNERAPSTPGLHLHRVVIFALNFASYQNREATCFYENLRLFRDRSTEETRGIARAKGAGFSMWNKFAPCIRRDVSLNPRIYHVDILLAYINNILAFIVAEIFRLEDSLAMRYWDIFERFSGAGFRSNFTFEEDRENERGDFG